VRRTAIGFSVAFTSPMITAAIRMARVLEASMPGMRLTAT
jgi:hypothetical protein